MKTNQNKATTLKQENICKIYSLVENDTKTCTCENNLFAKIKLVLNWFIDITKT